LKELFEARDYFLLGVFCETAYSLATKAPIRFYFNSACTADGEFYKGVFGLELKSSGGLGFEAFGDLLCQRYSVVVDFFD